MIYTQSQRCSPYDCRVCRLRLCTCVGLSSLTREASEGEEGCLTLLQLSIIYTGVR